MFEPGERLGDNYEVLEFISVGADAEVYRVLNRTDNHEYAAKVPLDGNASHQFQHENEIYRVVREKTNSDHLVKVHPAIEHEGCPIIIMEFLKGRSLQNVIDAEKPKSEARIHRIVTNILEGLNELHRAGIIHCDIKPSNVILTKRGAVLFDFSASLIEKEVDQNSPRRGSKNYMPPDELPSFAWDVYSVGVIYYQLFLGAPPNWVRNTTDKTSTAPTLTLPEHFGKYLGARPIIMKALSLDPEQRYQHAGTMLEDLTKPLRSGRFLEGIRIFDRRYPALLKTAGVLLAVLVIGFLGVSYYLNKRAAKQDQEKTIQVHGDADEYAQEMSTVLSLNPPALIAALGELPETDKVSNELKKAEIKDQKLKSYEGLVLGISGIALYTGARGEIDSYELELRFQQLSGGRNEKVTRDLDWSIKQKAFVWNGDRYLLIAGVTQHTLVEVRLEGRKRWFNKDYRAPVLPFTQLQPAGDGFFEFKDDGQQFGLRFDGRFFAP